MFGTLATKQGKDPNPWDYQMRWMDETVARGGRLWGQATTRSINAIFSLKSYLPFDKLPEWQEIRALPLGRAEGAAARSRGARPAGRRGSPDEAEGRELQGGGAATTDPRKPDYANLFPMLDVDWDDPSVADLARQQNKHPVEVIIDLCAGERQPDVRAAAGQRVAGGRARPAEAPAHAWRPSPIPARMSARRWARRCRPTC